MLKQVRTVTMLNLRNLSQRLAPSLVVVVGMAGVVGVLVCVLAMARGFAATVTGTARPDRVILLSDGAAYEGGSSLSRATVDVIRSAPGIRAVAGQPVLSAELLVFIPIPKKSDGLDASVLLRGVGPQFQAVRPEVHLVQGRMFRRGVHELIVGRLAQRQFRGLEVGNRIRLPNGDWTVVGSFESGGDSSESELLADNEAVMAAAGRNVFQSVTAQLQSPASFGTLRAALAANPTLKVDVIRETDYFAAQASGFKRFLLFVAYAVGGIMAAGALFAALNTMYSAISARTTEIATLRAMGFGEVGVMVSVFVEILLLSLLGALIGVAGAWLLFNGHALSSNGLVYTIKLTPGLTLVGILVALVIGSIGGLLPAVRIARAPLATLLRGI